jgi:hypothetical protein
VSQAVPADDVLLHEEKGEAMLLHVASGLYFGLNRSGVVVWHALVESRDPVEALLARWPHLDPAACRADTDALVDALVEAGLAHRPEP